MKNLLGLFLVSIIILIPSFVSAAPACAACTVTTEPTQNTSAPSCMERQRCLPFNGFFLCLFSRPCFHPCGSFCKVTHAPAKCEPCTSCESSIYGPRKPFGGFFREMFTPSTSCSPSSRLPLPINAESTSYIPACTPTDSPCPHIPYHGFFRHLNSHGGKCTPDYEEFVGPTCTIK